MFFYYLLGKVERRFQPQPVEIVLTFALFTLLLVYIVFMFGMAKQFPSLFDVTLFQLEKDELIYFAISIVLALPLFAWTLLKAKEKRLNQTSLFSFIDENIPGLVLGFFFFSIYLIFASIFNQPAFDVDDIFFDSDGLLWRTRFTTPDYQDYYWRSVHPFVLLIVRPLITLFSFLFRGDKLVAAFVLTAFAGALCVFLAWYFIKYTIKQSLYALLIASILGASAAHLVFGSLIETYIFLAAVMMTFLVLLLKDRPLFILIFAGLLSFGITITNFIQTAITFIFVKQDFKQWVKYGLLVGVLVVPLTLLNNFIYPDSQPYFFIPSSFTTEADNTFTPSVGRALAIARAMFFHSIVAPDPLILEEEIPFLKVWIFKADPMRLSEYETVFGTVLAFGWLGLMLLGSFLFLKNLKREDNRFSFAFIFIVLFNFALHLQYGKDLFLYSTNWTYAIILFFALAWKEIANKRWFQITLLVFLTLLLVNNSRLILTMLNTSALHIK
ncbi:MAG: hypothetical protein H7Y59_10825 [Anaerolineales bacterium]|nr:hypothetical protein [Anaerolineales bacterium]